MGGELVLPGAVSETALELPGGLSFEEWEHAGRTLGQIEKAVQWWIGDWLNYGERAYGEKYAQAMEVTGLEYDTLAGYAWVAREVESCRRRQTLSFSHHMEVAALEPPKQEAWLIEAEASGWSRNRLREEVQGRSNGTAPEEEVCPTCHRAWPKGKRQ